MVQRGFVVLFFEKRNGRCFASEIVPQGFTSLVKDKNALQSNLLIPEHCFKQGGSGAVPHGVLLCQEEHRDSHGSHFDLKPCPRQERV